MNQLIPTSNAAGSRRGIHYVQERGWSVPWTIRRVERRVSPPRRRGIDNRAVEREGSQNRRRTERRVASAPTPASRIRVLVVEDNRLMRDGLARLLGAYADVDIVASAENANTATQQLRDLKPHVVLLDAALANGDSFTFLANLRATAPDAKAVVMDFVPAQQDVHQFIDGGANGFIMKDATAEDIVKAIRSVANGTDLPPPPAAPRSATPDGGNAASAAGGVVRLTKREQEIKELIAAGLGNKEIAQRLNIATNTVKSHVHNMLGKLAALTPPDRRRGNRSRRGSSRRSYRFTR
jgi:DNA-binding NarL/FixJ family response regulator